MGKAMFTLIGAMAELESSLVSERVAAAKSRGKHVGRPQTPAYFVDRIETLARTTAMSVRQIQKELREKVSRGVVGEIVKRARHQGKA